jgi:hypothetical protein
MNRKDQYCRTIAVVLVYSHQGSSDAHAMILSTTIYTYYLSYQVRMSIYVWELVRGRTVCTVCIVNRTTRRYFI